MRLSRAHSTARRNSLKNKLVFNKPLFIGRELSYVRDAIRRGQLAGDGYYSHLCSDFLQKFVGAKRVFLTSSCTHAMELAYLTLGIKPGDEVIVPSFTFPSTVNAFVIRGAKPVFVDIRPDTLNIDANLIANSVSRRTRAISPVHYGGVVGEMDAISAIAKKHHLSIIEDAAHALGASYKGTNAGQFGTFGAFSFHETKNYSSGEGGALALSDPELIRRAEIIRQKGTNRAAFLRGEVDKYTWVDVGSSYLPSELQAAYLYAQLREHKKIWKKRKEIFETYHAYLRELELTGDLRLPIIPKECVSAYHNFYVLVRSGSERQRLIAHLSKDNIQSVFHYVPLHDSPMGRRFGYKKGQFPVSEKIGECLLRLPFHYNLTDKDIRRVVGSIKRFF